MQEMTIKTALTLLAILTPLNIFLWHHLGTYRLHIKPKTEPEGNNPRRLTNANYGAYIQAQGRYYN
ncbi:TPA: hypothetical protein U1B17_001440 [Streptococcus suis]|nr:hypothetical protein [Streptococcus suis]HEM3494336.1 hypothetical protein [Streptococcus suis]